MRTIPVSLALLLLAGSVCAQAPVQEPFSDSAPSTPITIDLTERAWLRAEYLPWVTTTRRGLETGQELTSSPLVNTLLTSTNTTDEDLFRAFFDGKRGYRLTAGAWLDSANQLGVEASATWLYRNSLGTPTTPADFFATVLPGLSGTAGGGTFVIPVGVAGLVNATLQLELGDQKIFNYEVVGRGRLLVSEFFRVDGLLGARYLTFDESLAITADVTIPGGGIRARAGYDARTAYLGAVIGLDGEVSYASWFLGVRPRATFAHVQNEVTRQVTTQATLPGVGTLSVDSAAVLGDTTKQSRSWTMLPELDVQAGRQFGQYARVMIGASLLALPKAARASGQLNPGLPIGTLVPDASLLLAPQRETIYLLTMSAGVELRF